MPYVNKDSRIKLDRGNVPGTSDRIIKLGQDIDTPGELNYVITRLCLQYLKNKEVSKYQFMNDVVGVLECSKHEIYRRLIADYEDLKAKENGDII